MSDLIQPEYCKYDNQLSCGYPIDDCDNCPANPNVFDPYWGMTTSTFENGVLTCRLNKQRGAGEGNMIDLEKITTEMAEYICDNICRHPKEVHYVSELIDICSDCKLGRFVCDIINIERKGETNE